MSLVGPRPFFPQDVLAYEARHLSRYSVLPGITGEWQVNGRSQVQDFEQVIAHDLEYIHQWSIAKDLRILAKTIPAVIRAHGAV